MHFSLEKSDFFLAHLPTLNAKPSNQLFLKHLALICIANTHSSSPGELHGGSYTLNGTIQHNSTFFAFFCEFAFNLTISISTKFLLCVNDCALAYQLG